LSTAQVMPVSGRTIVNVSVRAPPDEGELADVEHAATGTAATKSVAVRRNRSRRDQVVPPESIVIRSPQTY
jgi:hypothetical protein